jgi:hypothetical protein
MAKDAPVVQRLARSRKVAYTKVEGRMQNAECRKADLAKAESRKQKVEIEAIG